MSDILAEKRIVVKVGTSTLTSGREELFLPGILEIVRQLAALNSQGYEVILVSSGAIAAGRELMQKQDNPPQIPAKQMLAAIGQPRLMEIYAQLFRIYGLYVAQVLLTRSDLARRRGYINARNTLTGLIEQGIIPIVNENDAVATEEIRVGDNDNLSALVANLVEADMLILLTDQAGLYTNDPRNDPDAKLISEINGGEIPEHVWHSAGGTSTGLGTGGMLTKIKAADMARRTGTTVVIARGDERDILSKVIQKKSAGTRITALLSKVESRKRYMLSGMKTSCSVIVLDNGAIQALKNGNSLLPIGILSVKGKFERGDIVQIAQEEGRNVALGLSNYDSKDVKKISHRKSDEIERVLGYTFGDEVIHRSNLVLL